jgi:hypothetical protein
MADQQSWAPTIEKMSDSRHRLSTTNTRKPIPDNQELRTISNKQQRSTTNIDTPYQKPTPDNQQSTIDEEENTARPGRKQQPLILLCQPTNLLWTAAVKCILSNPKGVVTNM